MSVCIKETPGTKRKQEQSKETLNKKTNQVTERTIIYGTAQEVVYTSIRVMKIQLIFTL